MHPIFKYSELMDQPYYKMLDTKCTLSWFKTNKQERVLKVYRHSNARAICVTKVFGVPELKISAKTHFRDRYDLKCPP